MGWCQLRQLSIHPDLVGELWCHHWTASPPRLPTVGTSGRDDAGEAPPPSGRQLSFTGFPKDL